MINRLMDRYIARHVLGAVGIVLVVLTLLSSSFTLLAEMGNLRMQYHFWQALQYVTASMPNMLLQMLPVSVLIGCITGLGVLSAHNELTIMQISGMSRLRICFSTIKPVFFLIIIAMLAGEFIIPKIQGYAEEKRKVERTLNHDSYPESGIWWRHENNYIHIGNIKNNTLENIDIFRFNHKHRLLETVRASQAIKKGNAWQLINVETVTMTRDKTIKTESPTVPWNINLESRLLKIALADPETLSIRNLFTYIQYIKKQHLDTKIYELALYKRLLEPFTIISLLLIGISFIFGPLRSVSMGYRLFMGVSVGVIFMLIQNLMAPVSIVFGFSAIIAVLLPAFICLCIAFLLLAKKE